jgi:salicylate hydroxylase
MSIVGIAPTNAHPLLQRRVLQILDGSQRVFIKPFDDDTCMWQLTYPRDEPDTASRAQESALDEAKVRCQTWMEPIPALMQATPVGKIRYAPLYDREPVSTKTRVPEGPVALVGDAAHPMSPFKGQGANQVLEDARDLSAIIIEALASGESFEAAFKRFIPIMAKRSVPKVHKSRQHVKFYHQPTCLDQQALFAYHGLKESESMRKLIANADSHLHPSK